MGILLLIVVIVFVLWLACSWFPTNPNFGKALLAILLALIILIQFGLLHAQ